MKLLSNGGTGTHDKMILGRKTFFKSYLVVCSSNIQERMLFIFRVLGNLGDLLLRLGRMSVVFLDHFDGISVPRPGTIVPSKLGGDVPRREESHPLLTLVNDKRVMVLRLFKVLGGSVTALGVEDRFDRVAHYRLD